MHFEVRLAVRRRATPVPPALWANPHVECVWGAPPDDDDADDGVVDGGGGGGRAAGSAPVRFATPAAPNDAVAPRWNLRPPSRAPRPALARTTFPPLPPAARRSPLTRRARPRRRYVGTMAQLRSRRLLLGVHHRRPFLADAAGGGLELTLEIAVGPTKFDLPLLTRRGAPAGRIVVSIEMVQRCNLQVSLPDVVPHALARAARRATR